MGEWRCPSGTDKIWGQVLCQSQCYPSGTKYILRAQASINKVLMDRRVVRHLPSAVPTAKFGFNCYTKQIVPFGAL
jgi:hypothetical protein